MSDISSQSIIEKGAKIADDVIIGPYCYIGPKVKIAAGCVIHNNVTLVGNTTIGPNCQLFPMSVVGSTIDGNETKGKCVIGEACALREHVTIYAGSGRKPTRIGNDNLIMVSSQVGPGAQLGDHGIFANCTHIAAAAIIEDYVRTSAFTFIDEGRTVGAYSFTAGYVYVDRDVPPYAMVQGSPFRVRGVNSHNLKACGFGENNIRTLKRVYRDLFNGTGQLKPDVLNDMLKQRQDNALVTDLLKLLKKQAGVSHA